MSWISNVVRTLVVVLSGVQLVAQSSSSGGAPPANSSPVVSPDGRLIAFLSNRSGNPDLFVISADGSDERQLTRTPDAEGRPEWSRDGKRVFYAIAAGERSRLFTIEVASGATAELGSVSARGVAISPDGKRIAYMAGTWQASQLAVAGIDGGGAKVLTTPEQTGIAWNARFSPDGEWIAFTGQDRDRQLHVFVVRVDGSGFRQLTHFKSEEGRAQVPAWSADGKQIAFQLNRKGSSDLWRVNADGTDARRVLAPSPSVLDEVPSWFPDQRRIAFQSTRSGRMEIWVVDADGGNARQVTGI